MKGAGNPEKGLKKDLEKLLASGVLKKGGEIREKGSPPPPGFALGERISAGSGEVFLHRELFAEGRGHGRGIVFAPVSLSLGFLEKIPGFSGEADVSKIAFLDIETTGLASGCKAFLTGIGRWVPGEGFAVAQYFMENSAQEPPLLEAVAKEARDSSLIVTYNGACFDLPVLEDRARAKGMEPLFESVPHLDLLPFARSAWKHCSGNCRLTTMEEEILGFRRTGDVPGREIPGVYREYLLRGRSGRMKEVFHHNALDILSLACLFLKGAEAEEGEAPMLDLYLSHRRKKIVCTPEDTGVCRPKPRKRADELSSLKALLKLREEEGDLEGMAEVCRELMDKAPGDPRWVLELVRIKERGEKDPEGALEVAEAALSRGLWHPEDRKKIEEKRESLIRSRG